MTNHKGMILAGPSIFFRLSSFVVRPSSFISGNPPIHFLHHFVLAQVLSRVA
jgi:hypothetical protein